MKLLRYGQPGFEKPAVLDAAGGVHDVSALVSDFNPRSIATDDFATLLAARPEDFPLVGQLDQIGRIGTPVDGIRSVVAIGLNYADHAREAGQPVPTEPFVFLKSTSSLSGPNDPILMPPGAEKLDWEVELGIVIKRDARHVTEAEAPSCILGYCLTNDVSERAYQMERGGSVDKGKSYDSFCPVGPYIVTPDELGDAGKLPLWCSVNGEIRQNGSTANLIFSCAALISYVSQFLTLRAGDLIMTGTPAGVGFGMTPSNYLKPGDVVTLGIARLGEQRHTVILSRP